LVACVTGAVSLSLGSAVAFVVSWLIRYVLFIADILAKIPFAAVYTASSYVIIWIVLCYILLILYFTDKKRSAWIMLLCMSLGLVVASFASWLEPRMDSYRLSVLDVGQGQCVLIQQDGKNYMVDCGGDHNASVADKAAQLLLSQGVYKLDGLILTHYDTDHAGAAIHLLERVPAEQLYLPFTEDTGRIHTNLVNRYLDRITWVEPKNTVRVESIDITLFGGNNAGVDNEKGLCVLFQSPDCDILITGDMSKVGEKFLLEQTALPDLEVLVVGHHGAANATGLELLRETMPEVAIISVGKNNRYGQPSPEVLQRLDVFACNVFRTDIDGDIVIRG
jgi:competence protein ComEC